MPTGTELSASAERRPVHDKGDVEFMDLAPLDDREVPQNVDECLADAFASVHYAENRLVVLSPFVFLDTTPGAVRAFQSEHDGSLPQTCHDGVRRVLTIITAVGGLRRLELEWEPPQMYANERRGPKRKLVGQVRL